MAYFAWRWKEEKYKKFAARYERFEDEDVVKICPKHHAEIHQIYAAIIRRWRLKHWSTPMDTWPWERAEKLMQELRDACDEWMKKKTPGVDPKHVFRPKVYARRRQ